MGAADILRDHGWTKGTLFDSLTGRSCLVGASRIAFFGRIEGLAEDDAVWLQMAWKVIREQFPKDAESICDDMNSVCQMVWEPRVKAAERGCLDPSWALHQDISTFVIHWNDLCGTPEKALVVAEKADLMREELVHGVQC